MAKNKEFLRRGGVSLSGMEQGWDGCPGLRLLQPFLTPEHSSLFPRDWRSPTVSVVGSVPPAQSADMSYLASPAQSTRWDLGSVLYFPNGLH